MEILPSALKHGFSEEDITHAIANAMVIDWIDEGLLFIGADPSGTDLLEVKARQTDVGLVVFHAMVCKKLYLEKYFPK